MFGTLGTIIITAIIVGTLFALLNKRAFGKVFHWGKTQAGNVGRAAEQHDPVNQMREAAEEAREQIHTARDALVKNKSLKESLDRQVAKNKRDVSLTEGKLRKYKEEGRTKDDPDVITMAEKLAQARSELATNEKQLVIQTQLYNNTLTSAKKAAGKIGKLEQRANNLEVRLDTSAAQAELAEMLNSYSPSSVNGAVNKATRFEEIAEQQIAANQAKLQVNADLGLTVEDDDEAEISLEASSILDEFEGSSSSQPTCDTVKG